MFPHLFQLFGPRFLGLFEALLCLFGFFEPSHHLFVVRVFLPVLHLLKIFIDEVAFHKQVELAHLLGLRHHCHPGLLHRAVLRP